MPNDPVTITLRLNGPLKIQGSAVVRSLDGKILCEKTDIALCRCGQSADKPFCDGTHKKLPFQSG